MKTCDERASQACSVAGAWAKSCLKRNGKDFLELMGDDAQFQEAQLILRRIHFKNRIKRHLALLQKILENH